MSDWSQFDTAEKYNMMLPPQFLLLSPSYVLLSLSPSPVLLLKHWSGFWNTGKAPNATTISNAYFALTHIIGQISLRYKKEKNCLCNPKANLQTVFFGDNMRGLAVESYYNYISTYLNSHILKFFHPFWSVAWLRLTGPVKRW